MISESRIDYNHFFFQKIDDFDKLIQILINLKPVELFKEVKSIILNEFESTTKEIIKCLEIHKNENTSKFFNYTFYSILFIISNITLYIDYYTFTVNSIAEKMNRFFINLIGFNLDGEEFKKTMYFLEKFVQIKSSFLKEFCFNRKVGTNSPNQSQFHFDKFSSFGTYFFNNFKTMIDIKNQSIDLIYILVDFRENQKKPKKKKRGIDDVWINYYNNHTTKLDKFFALFFNSKLLSWKTSILNTKIEKDNTCRVCEKTLNSKDFILHSWICKEIKCSIPKLTSYNDELDRLIKRFEKKRNDLLEKENIFDCFSNFDTELKEIQNYKNSKIIDKIIKTPQCERKNFLVSTFLENIKKEKDRVISCYTKNPFLLINLNTILCFSIKLFSQNKNRFSILDKINTLFSKLFTFLFRKQMVIEYIITFKEIFEKTQNKIDKKDVSKMNFMTEITKNIKEVTSKLTQNSFKFEKKMGNKINFNRESKNRAIFNILKKDNGKETDENKEKLNLNNKKINKIKKELKGLALPFKTLHADKENMEFSYNSCSKNTSDNLSISLNNSQNSKNTSLDQTIELNILEEKPHLKKSLFSIVNCYLVIEPNKKKDIDYSVSEISIQKSPPKTSRETNIYLNELDFKFEENNKTQENIESDEDNSQRNEEMENNFNDILELLEDFKEEESTYTDKLDDKKQLIFDDCPEERVDISDFEFIRNIRKGGYGNVGLYKKQNTGDEFAIKIVDINNMKSLNVLNYLKNETEILNLINHEFLVKCYYIFSDEEKYYFVMENIQGGDLLGLMNAYKLKEETIKVLVAELILALEYLHSKNIIHRDLKPENILISNQGHLKLIDFGLSEVGLHNKIEDNIEKDKFNELVSVNYTKKVLGTANYIAPEMIAEEGEITDSVDYWALGVILYELYTEDLPFYSNSINETLDNILNCRINWELLQSAEFITEEAFDLIKSFLIFNKDKRWSYKNMKQIKEHDFFKGIDWCSIKKQSNISLRKYVCSKIKKEKELTESVKNEELSLKLGLEKKKSNIDFCSKKIDNLYEKNLALIKSNINVGKKILDAELEGLEIKDFIHDLDY